MIKFSIVIPAYNNKEVLSNTLTALNLQKGYGMEDYEVIVVDDGSPEKLIDSIREIPVNYTLNYLYLERTPNSCRASARNKGLAKAVGEIVIFLDSDMVVDANYLKEIDRCFKMDKNICLIATRFYIDKPIEADNIRNQTLFDTYKFKKCGLNNFESRHIVFDMAAYNMSILKTPWLFVFSCNMAVLKKNLEAVGGFDDSYKGWGHEDIDLGYKLHKSGVKIVQNTKIEAVHQYHGETALFFSWSVDKFWQNQGNEDYFFEKNHEIEKIIPYFYENTPYLFRKFKLNFFVTKEFKADKKYRIKVKQPEEVKRKLKAIAASGVKSKVYIYDSLENSDLDIYIQLFESENCHIRYYPKSRKGKKMEFAVYSLLYMILRASFGVYLAFKGRK